MNEITNGTSVEARYARVPIQWSSPLCRTGLLEVALPLAGIARVVGITDAEAPEALQGWIMLGFVQRFGEMGVEELYQSSPSARDFLTDPVRLSTEARRATHAEIAKVLRAAISAGSGDSSGRQLNQDDLLRYCFEHAAAAGEESDRRWAGVEIARRLRRQSKAQAALDMLTPLLGPSPDAEVLGVMASALFDLGRFAESRSRRVLALKLFRDAGDEEGESSALVLLAMLDRNEGKFTDARNKLTRSLALRRARGDLDGMASTLHRLGGLDFQEGRLLESRDHLEEALRMRCELGESETEAVHALTYELGVVEFREGNLAAAQSKLESWIAWKHPASDRGFEANALDLLATIDESNGKPYEAAKKWTSAAEIWKTLGRPKQAVRMLVSIATKFLELDDVEVAAVALRDAFRVAKNSGDVEAELQAIEAIGMLAWKRRFVDVGLTLLAMGQVARDEGSDKVSIAFDEMVRVARLGEDDVRALKLRASEHYRKNRGEDLVLAVLDPPSLPT